MSYETFGLQALAWLLTYAVHSTLLLLAAWILTARLVRSERAREGVWKLALVGGLATASVQRFAALEPHTGVYALESEPATERVAELDAAPPSATALFDAPLARHAAELALPPRFAPSEPLLRPTAPPVQETMSALPLSLGEIRGTVRAIDWQRWALAGWIAGGAALALLFAVAAARLRDRLAGRTRLREGPLVADLERLKKLAGVRRPVRLMLSPKLRAPVALGTLFPEICVPPRALGDLGREEREAMLAHELAHVARFDPTWLTVCRWMETLFFFQPLNRLARARLDHSAELLCDEQAVRWTGNRLGLARCLAEVATWMLGERRAVIACGMAGRRSRLAERVTRILDPRAEPESAPGWLAPAGGLAFAATIFLAPGFSSPVKSAESLASAPASPRDASDELASVETTASSTPDASAIPAELATTPHPSAAAAPRTATVRAPREAVLAVRDALQAEFGDLASEMDVLRAELTGRGAMPDELAARVAAIEERTTLLIAKKKRIDELIERWIAATDENTTIDAMDRSHQGGK